MLIERSITQFKVR